MAIRRVPGMTVQPEVGGLMYSYKKNSLYFDSSLKSKALTFKDKELIGTITEVTDKYIQVYYTQDSNNQQYLYLNRNTKYYSHISSVTIIESTTSETDNRNWFQKLFGLKKNMEDETTDTITPTPSTDTKTPTKSNMPFAAFIPLIGTAISSITSLLGKNSEVTKAEQDYKVAQQAVLAEREKTKQAGYAVDVEKIKLLEAKEITTQTKLREETDLAQQKQTIGLLTIVGVLVFLFGIGYLIVKYVLVLVFPKPNVQPQNVVIEE